MSLPLFRLISCFSNSTFKSCSEIILFRGNEELSDIKTKIKDETKTDEKKAAYYCALCQFRITDVSKVTEVNGQHRHVYANPVGNVFEIGCFNSAPGCLNEGKPTDECTWFSGFSWCYSLCGQCKLQLGWEYVSQGHGHFWGLILNRLTCK